LGIVLINRASMQLIKLMTLSAAMVLLSATPLLSQTPPAPGRPSATRAQAVSPAALDRLRSRIRENWLAVPNSLVLSVHVRLNPDGTLAGEPEVLTPGQGAIYKAARESLIRAIKRGQPYDMLSKATYDRWKEIEITFDPRAQ
jgi:hypothetical protein